MGSGPLFRRSGWRAVKENRAEKIVFRMFRFDRLPYLSPLPCDTMSWKGEERTCRSRSVVRCRRMRIMERTGPMGYKWGMCVWRIFPPIGVQLPVCGENCSKTGCPPCIYGTLWRIFWRPIERGCPEKHLIYRRKRPLPGSVPGQGLFFRVIAKEGNERPGRWAPLFRIVQNRIERMAFFQYNRNDFRVF